MLTVKLKDVPCDASLVGPLHNAMVHAEEAVQAGLALCDELEGRTGYRDSAKPAP